MVGTTELDPGQPGARRFAFREPLLQDSVPLLLALLMVLGYGLTFGLSGLYHVTGVKFFDQVADFFFYGGEMTKDVWSGQVWRPLTSAFLHGSFPHIAMNLLNFLLAAAAARVLFSRRGWLTVFLGAAYFGCLITIAISPEQQLVGASVGIMGLFGAIVAAEWRLSRKHKFDAPVERLFELKTLLLFLGLNLVLEHLIPNVGHVAHVAGLSVGFLLGLVLPLNGGQRLVASRADAIKVVGQATKRRDRKQVVTHVDYSLADGFDPAVDFLALVQSRHGLRKRGGQVYIVEGSADAAWNACSRRKEVFLADRFKVVGFAEESREETERVEAELAEKRKREQHRPWWWRIFSLLLFGYIWNYFFQLWAKDMTMDRASLDWLHALPPVLAEPAIAFGSVAGVLLVSGSFAYLIFIIVQSFLWGMVENLVNRKSNKSDSDSESEEDPRD